MGPAPLGSSRSGPALPETARRMEVVKELSAQSVSIIYISHRLAEIEELADRVVVLRDGRNAGTLSKQEINHEAIVTLMVGRDSEHFYRPPEVVAQAECIEVRNLRTRRYPNRPVSFTIRKGEILGFAGLVGAGRSELAQTMFGVGPAVSGELHLENKLVRTSSADDAIRNGIYLIPEDRRNTGLILDFSVCENITLPDLPRYSRGGLVAATPNERRLLKCATS
jgi:ribose transport system ATP-binding protein